VLGVVATVGTGSAAILAISCSHWLAGNTARASDGVGFVRADRAERTSTITPLGLGVLQDERCEKVTRIRSPYLAAACALGALG
jgi:hypothetical protein